MKRRLLFFFLLVSSFAFAQNNIYRSGGITQTIGAPTFTPGASGNIVAIDTVTGEWYVNPNRLSGASWISAGYRLTVISGSIAPAYTPTAHQSHFVINAANRLYYWTGSAWVNINAGGGGGGTTYYPGEGIDITNDTISIDTVQRLIFHSDQTYTGGIGSIRWNDTEGTLDLGLKNGNVTLQLGQESLQLVKHADNSGLTDGKVVYLVGSSGTNMTVRYARADSESTSANTFGLMTESATGGNKAFCTTFGLVRNINTDNLTEGGMVWLSKDTAGAMTAVRPTAPNHGVEIGFCVRKHATQGVIFVTVQNGYELNELHNVYVPSPASNQVLTFNSTNNRWQAATVADQSNTNEGTLGVSAGSATTSVITSNTDSATGVTIEAGTGISVSETTASNGGTITVTNSAPDQTVSITNGGGITPSGTYPNFTLTAADQSATNEIQTIDTFSLSGQTLRASLSNDNQPAKTVTLPVVGISAGTNVTVSQAAGVYTINSTGGSSLSGVTGYVSQFNSSTTIDTTGLFWGNGSRLGIGTTTPSARVDIVGESTTSTTNAIEINNSSRELLKVANNGAITIGKNDITATQNTASIAASGSDANIGIAIVSKGTGAITASIPDGATSGGNARGTYALDLQVGGRTSITQVASGNYSVITGGYKNEASSTYSVVLGGESNIASGVRSVSSGTQNQATGTASSVIGGYSNAAIADYSMAGGFNSRAYLYGQRSYSGSNFLATENRSGAAQRSDIGAYRSITGTATQELTLDGSSPVSGNRIILALPATATAGRLWNAKIQISAICQTAGGSVTVGESFIGTYNVGIKRISASTSLVGTVQNMITAQSDTNMSSSVVTITADDTNESLKIEFTPPTGANASTVIRVVATVYLTEVGY